MTLAPMKEPMVASTRGEAARSVVSPLPVLLPCLVRSSPRSAKQASQLGEEVLCVFSLLGLLPFLRCYQGTVMDPGYWNENSPKGNLVLWKNPVNGLTSWINMTF